MSEAKKSDSTDQLGQVLETLDRLWPGAAPWQGHHALMVSALPALLAAERERIAVHFDSRDKDSGGFYEPHEPAKIIRALGPNVKVEPPRAAEEQR